MEIDNDGNPKLFPEEVMEGIQRKLAALGAKHAEELKNTHDKAIALLPPEERTQAATNDFFFQILGTLVANQIFQSSPSVQSEMLEEIYAEAKVKT